MANVNSPFGFRQAGLYGGAVSPSFGLVTMKIAPTGDTSVYGEGDPLKFVDTGYVTAFTIGTAVSQLAGIFKSCSYYSTALGRRVWSNYYPGSGVTGATDVLVEACSGAPAPQFVVQSGGSSAVTLAARFANVDILSGSSTAGTATGGFYRSAAVLDTTYTNTATLPFRVVDLWANIAPPGAAGTDASTYNWVVVTANVSQATGL